MTDDNWLDNYVPSPYSQSEEKKSSADTSNGSDFFDGVEKSPFAPEASDEGEEDYAGKIDVTFTDFILHKVKPPTILPTRKNLEDLINAVGMDVRFDVYTRRLVAWIDGKEIDNHVDATLIDLAIRSGLPKSTVTEQLDAFVLSRPINKPLQWLEGLKKPEGDPLLEWLLENDLVSISFMEDDLPAPQKQWEYTVWNKMLIAACAAADQLERCTIKDAICKFEQVMVLVSDQGMKKSSAVQGLLPKELQPYFGGGVHLDLGSKDSVVEATGYWIAELGEIDATFNKSDIAALKAILSRNIDVVRLPYDRRAQRTPRRTVFFASVNDEHFLQDTTGNRRYLPVKVSKPLVYSEEVGARIFAQAWHRYFDGEQWWLTEDETDTAKVRQAEHDGNNLTSLIKDAFDFDSPLRELKIKPGIILQMFGYNGASVSANTKKLASALKLLRIERYGESARDQRHYAMPPLNLRLSLYQAPSSDGKGCAE